MFLATIAPLSGQSQAAKPPPHGTAVVRPLSLSTGSTPELVAIADTTRAHIVLRLKAEGVVIVDRSQRLRGAELNKFVAAHFAIFGVVGIVDTQFVVIARLASMDTGDSLSQIRLAGSPASAAEFGDSLGTLFAPTILGRPLAER
jgi:hypothetical protein